MLAKKINQYLIAPKVYEYVRLILRVYKMDKYFIQICDQIFLLAEGGIFINF
jgi:hypothetical protein